MAQAKKTLPISINCVKASATQANVKVVFTKAANNATITVRGMGSVEMETLVQNTGAVSKGGEVTLNPSFKSGTTPGGVAVHVKADFGAGPEFQVQSFNLVKGTGDNQKNGKTRPTMIIVPANTTTK